MNDRKEIPHELLEKILADTHTDSPRPTFMSQGMGAVLGLWQCSCGFMASGNFCEQCGAPKSWICLKCSAHNTGNFCTECGTRKPWECPMCKAINIGEKCGRCGLSEPSAK